MFGTNPIDFHCVAYPQNSYNKSLVGFTPMKCITGDNSLYAIEWCWCKL